MTVKNSSPYSICERPLTIAQWTFAGTARMAVRGRVLPVTILRESVLPFALGGNRPLPAVRRPRPEGRSRGTSRPSTGKEGPASVARR
jgi:hypothetical protein